MLFRLMQIPQRWSDIVARTPEHHAEEQKKDVDVPTWTTLYPYEVPPHQFTPLAPH